MSKDKAYKILAKKHTLSHKQAKALIDKGLVHIGGKKLTLARAYIPSDSHFEILEIRTPQVLFCNDEILAVDKPAFIESYDLCTFYEGWNLLHRLDRETSGVILLIKEKSAFAKKCKEAFKEQKVQKEYRAIVHGRIVDSISIEKPISTIRRGFAKSYIDKNGLYAYTQLNPLAIVGKKTLVQVYITTGRTHQIRVHCQSLKHPIYGDRIYGIQDSAPRLMLHAHKIALLGYEFVSPIPKELQLEHWAQ
ncbi:pseudouridine synthase family protein [Helicobacter marmotae]|uniref:RNA pseudouridylate synthase n=1 Tax=Helicobacter marmotae TaxID=152490 RepID=A0A3D8I3E2_9HELI|nr:RluA family pseudouridine synthase [Helicobacter marmotae]RDU59506.1 RluA family pseudouridine synthase [Helicobacter marmotae]